VYALAAALALGFVLVLTLASAQEGEDGEELRLQGIGTQGLGDPPAAGTTVLYMFSGAVDNLFNVATVVHCSNYGPIDSQVSVEFYDVDSDVYTATDNIPSSESRTFSSRPTALYVDHAVAGLTTDDLNQGAGRVIVPNDNTSIICTAQVIHSTTLTPSFGVQLALHDGAGKPVAGALIITEERRIYLSLVLRQFP
jgi:hypothetical protein